MASIKIEKVDNGYILSWSKPQFGAPPDNHVQIQPDMKAVVAVLEKEFK